MNRNAFFNRVRDTLFRGRLSQIQVEGLNLFLDAIEGEYSHLSIPEHAYVLATAHHETGGRFEPVREGFAKSDGQAVRRIAAARRAGRIKANYITPINGRYYYGRGFVQITWPDNYRKMGDIVGEPLFHEPDLALRPEIALKLIYEGMIRGTYTGRKLSHYFSPSEKDYYQARRIINRMDKARLIADYAETFEAALTYALHTEEQFADQSTGKKAYQSTTNWATGATAVAGVTGAVNSVLDATDDITGTFERVKEKLLSDPLLVGCLVVIVCGAAWIFNERRKKKRDYGV